MSDVPKTEVPPITPERVKMLSGLADELIAWEASARLWARIHAQRQAIREVAKGI